MEIWMVLLGWILFAGTHIGLSSDSIRSGMINKMGEKGFQGVYSLIALVTFVFLVLSYKNAKSSEVLFFALGKDSVIMMIGCNLLMLFAFVFLFAGFTDKTPMGMGSVSFKAHGIVRITRHPMNTAFALFGLSHLLIQRSIADWIFLGGFVIYGYFGSLHQDGKKVKQTGGKLEEFVSNTSIIPFAAIIKGKQPLKLGEISKLGMVLGIIATAIARILHPSIRAALF
ncbi:NnrU family protein [bacterium]|nr:NnrU family protein [bacterium]